MECYISNLNNISSLEADKNVITMIIRTRFYIHKTVTDRRQPSSSGMICWRICSCRFYETMYITIVIFIITFYKLIL